MSTPAKPTATAPDAPAPRPDYQLAREPDGRSWTGRENLVDILERELLGPVGGPDEVLHASPDSAYLIGRIAPKRLVSAGGDPQQADTDEPVTDIGDAVDAAQGRGVPVTAVEDSGAGSGESAGTGADMDAAEDEPPKRGLMIPASMGLRCQIPDDLGAFTVTASWGIYHPLPEQAGEKTGARVSRYQRTPIEITKTITVTELDPTGTTTVHLKDEVVLRIDRHDDPEHGRGLIEVALCNDRETPPKIPVSAWLYQTRLRLDAGGAEVFLPVTDAREDTHPEPDDELRRLNLQYRDRLEFAHGRTCSVDWSVAEGARRASAVWTTWLPSCETPQTSPEEVGEALLDMTELAAASAERLRAGLEPIVTGYTAWLAGEQQRA
jgi:hypothetical protein